MKTILIAFILLLTNTTFGQEYPLEFEIENLKNSDGNIIVSVYEDSKSFDDGIPHFRKTISKKENINGGIFKA